MNVRRQDARTALSIAAPARPDSRQRQTTVLWIIALLLAVIATALLTRGSSPFALPQAHGDAPMAGARGIFAFTGQIDRNRFGLFMMDVDSSNVWCYEYLPGTRKLKLVAARSFLYDRYLDDYETEEPSPRQVKSMLEKQRQAVGRNNGFADAGDDVEAGKAIDTTEPVNTVAPIDVNGEEHAEGTVEGSAAPEIETAVHMPQVLREPPPPAPAPVVVPPPASAPPTTPAAEGAAPAPSSPTPMVEPLEEVPSGKK